MARSAKITVRAALPTIFSWQNGIGIGSINWELEALGLPNATIEDLRAVGAYQTGCTQDWRIESVDLYKHMERGGKLCDLSYKFRAACPEWRAERTDMIRSWIVRDLNKSR